MMAWYRAAFIALFIHLAVLLIFTFTFKGTRDMYKIDLIFWGSILRAQEVSSEHQRLSPGPEDVRGVDMASGHRTRLLLWSKGISIDKPDLSKGDLSSAQEDPLRFIGERVVLDEQEGAGIHPESEAPQFPPVKMRLERP